MELTGPRQGAATIMTTITVTSSIAQLRHLPPEDRLAAARRLIPVMEGVLARGGPVSEQTAARLWIRLARGGTGRPVAVRRPDQLTREQARDIALDALAAGDPLKDIAEAWADLDAKERAAAAAKETLRAAVVAGLRSGVGFDAVASAAHVTRSTVHEWVGRAASGEAQDA